MRDVHNHVGVSNLQRLYDAHAIISDVDDTKAFRDQHRFGFTVWEVELTDRVLSTLDAEQWSCRHLKSWLEEHVIPDQSPVHDLPLASHIKPQSSQRTPEHTWTGENELV